MFDTLMVFMKECFEKFNFEKNQQTTSEDGQMLEAAGLTSNAVLHLKLRKT